MEMADFSLADWLYHLEHRYQDEIQLGLVRVNNAASRLHVLPLDVPVITVAGTNGKGSTVAALEAIYLAAGYRVATYTSPHLLKFNERIRINGQSITDEQLCALFLRIEQCRDDIPLTYFEMTTLAALCYFKASRLDVIILEVGMGGRLDATNIVDADLAIITTIDLDHQAYLGETKEAIGAEKAGILRPHRPCVYADESPPVTILEQARLLNARLYQLGVDYSFKTKDDQVLISSPSGRDMSIPLPRINTKAAVSAIIASTLLSERLPVSEVDWQTAMQCVYLAGRQQVVENEGVTTIFDVAHNPQAVSLLATFIDRYQPKNRVYAVFSGLKDKDLGGLIKPMRAYVDCWFPATLRGKRASSASLLLKALTEAECMTEPCFDNPKTAYEAALKAVEPGDLIVVYGSFLTVHAIITAKEQEGF